MIKKSKLKFEPHEHLEFWVKRTSYADRLLWLEQSQEFIRSLEKNPKYRKLPKEDTAWYQKQK